MALGRRSRQHQDTDSTEARLDALTRDLRAASSTFSGQVRSVDGALKRLNMLTRSLDEKARVPDYLDA